MEIYMNIMSLTAVELGKKIKAKEISVEEAVMAALDAIEKKEKLVNSFVTVDKEGALKRAKEVQKQIDDGILTGPLAGVPVAIKDNMCTKDLLTTCSSKILYNFIYKMSGKMCIHRFLPPHRVPSGPNSYSRGSGKYKLPVRFLPK